MRFLTLSSAQFAALALVSTAIIVALYFMKHRRQRFEVSSIQLWRRVIEHHLENSIFEKLRRLLSIVLAVAIGLLLVFAIARPEIDLISGKPRRVVIVLDSSPGMQTRWADGGTRWEHAIEAAQGVMDSESVTTQFRLTDTAQAFDSAFISDRPELRRLLSRMHPGAESGRFPDVSGTPAWFISDGVVPISVPEAVHEISVFQAVPNVGITAFEVRSIPAAPLTYEAYLEVGNFGKEGHEVEITVSGSGEHRVTKVARIAAGETVRQEMDLSSFEGGAVQASVHSDGDAFPLDDMAYSYLPMKRRAKTLLVTSGNGFLETVLKAHPLVDLSTVAPASYTNASGFDMVVFDRFAPPETPSRPTLIFGAPSASWLPPHRNSGNASRISFETWMEEHPLLRGLSLHDVSIDKATRIDTTGANVLASDGAGDALIVASDQPKWILLTFDLQSSDFGYHDGFPVFIDNAIQWFDHDRLAISRTPGTVSVPFTGVKVQTADGAAITSRTHQGSTVFEAPAAGLYVVQGDTTHYIAVNLANRQSSAINDSHIKPASGSPVQLPFLRHEIWFYLLIAALLLFGLEWFTYHKRITV
jgi:hypothetical protein